MAHGAGALCISSSTVLGSAKCCLLARGKEQEENSEDIRMIAGPEAFLFSRCSAGIDFLSYCHSLSIRRVCLDRGCLHLC